MNLELILLFVSKEVLFKKTDSRCSYGDIRSRWGETLQCSIYLCLCKIRKKEGMMESEENRKLLVPLKRIRIQLFLPIPKNSNQTNKPTRQKQFLKELQDWCVTK